MMRLAALLCAARVVDFGEVGAVHDDKAAATYWKNGALLNSTLASLQPGDTFVIPNRTYHVMGGIVSSGLRDVVISLDGTLVFSDDYKHWPRTGNGDKAQVLMCISLDDTDNVTLTSSGVGILDGQGSAWWGIPGVGYLQRGENRPRLLQMTRARNTLLHGWHFHQSPYWTFMWRGVGSGGLEVRHSEILVNRDGRDSHGTYDMTAFNTDGFDVEGNNVWIHDCKVWNQDDCIAVKGGSNMVFERIEASGVGLTIGSIHNKFVNNITFRDCYMHHTYKGIYMKKDGNQVGAGLISNVLYENIVIDEPEQWAIWIGPAQQSDSANPCAAHPCSICWPKVPFSKCNGQAGLYENITLRNITILKPKMSPGVILADPKVPMKNVVFDGVRVIGGSSKPWGKDGYKCEGVQGVATGGTSPVPPCFTDRTDHQVLV